MPPEFRQHFAQPRCELCNTPVPEGTRFCPAPLCQTRARVAAAQQAAATTKAAWEREKTLAKRRTQNLLREVARRTGAENLGAIAYAIVPHVRGGTAPLPAERLAEFLDHLDAIIAEAFAEDDDQGRVFAYEEAPGADFESWNEQAEDEPRALVASCIACQGDCCFRGRAEQAFLTPNTVDWVRHRRPEATPADIRDAYIARLPDESVPDSCVFHGPQGCTLPRTMRAEICNSWQCSYRRELARQIAAKGADRSVVAGLPRDHDQRPGAGASSVKMVSVDSEHGVRVHDDLSLPELRLPKNT